MEQGKGDRLLKFGRTPTAAERRFESQCGSELLLPLRCAKRLLAVLTGAEGGEFMGHELMVKQLHATSVFQLLGESHNDQLLRPSSQVGYLSNSCRSGILGYGRKRKRRFALLDKNSGKERIGEDVFEFRFFGNERSRHAEHPCLKHGGRRNARRRLRRDHVFQHGAASHSNRHGGR